MCSCVRPAERMAEPASSCLTLCTCRRPAERIAGPESSSLTAVCSCRRLAERIAGLESSCLGNYQAVAMQAVRVLLCTLVALAVVLLAGEHQQTAAVQRRLVCLFCSSKLLCAGPASLKVCRKSGCSVQTDLLLT